MDTFQNLDLDHAQDIRYQLQKEAAQLEQKVMEFLSELEDRRLGDQGTFTEALEKTEATIDTMELYSGQLETMSQEIHRIDYFNHNFDIQLKNKTRLLDELKRVLECASIPFDLIGVLNRPKLHQDDELIKLESVLEELLEILNVEMGDNIMVLRAVREKRQTINNAILNFSKQLVDHVSLVLDGLSPKPVEFRNLKLVLSKHNPIYSALEKYGKLVPMLKNIAPKEHSDLQKYYIKCVGKQYRDEFEGFLANMQQNYLKVSSKCQFLFSASTDHNKQHGSKSTRESATEPVMFEPYKAIDHVLDLIVSSMSEEADFCFGFFFCTKESEATLQSVVDPLIRQLFGHIYDELHQFVDQLLTLDRTGGIQIMVVVEKWVEKLKKDGLEPYFMCSVLKSLIPSLEKAYHEFISAQSETIKENPVSVYKRARVQSSALFSPFVSGIEDMIQHLDKESPTRAMCRSSYSQILSQVLKAIKVKELHGVMGPKQMLEFCAMKITSYQHLEQALRQHENLGLESFRYEIEAERSLSLLRYSGLLVQRVFGNVYFFVEGIEALLRQDPSADVSSNSKYSREIAVSVFSKLSRKELSRQLQSALDLIQNQFNREFVHMVWSAFQKELLQTYKSFSALVKRIYMSSKVGFVFTQDEVSTEFSQLDT